MDPEHARRVLAVDRTTTAEQLRAAYHDRLRATHPDLNGGSSA
ncbi:MAG: molecular chaperone DnaJ, partial [Acidimicrobiia bacterium]|nr:molecular chaperone DnaJ [Acidimicrobiia bacterium]